MSLLLLGLSGLAEAKAPEAVREATETQPFVVHDIRNSLKAVCFAELTEGKETGSSETCLTKRLESARFVSSTTFGGDNGPDYARDSRLEQPSADLIESQREQMEERLSTLGQHLGSKIAFISKPVLRFGEYTPERLAKDVDGDGHIQGEEEEANAEAKAPYKEMVAYLALNQSLTEGERSALFGETCNAEGWCLTASPVHGLWSFVKDRGQLIGYTGNVSELEGKAPWGIQVRIQKKANSH